MNYIVNNLDFSLFQFGPADVIAQERSLGKIVNMMAEEQFYWFLEETSTLKSDLLECALDKKNPMGYFFSAFHSVEDALNPELIGYQPEDKVVVINKAPPESFLTYAMSGFRYFELTFKKRPFQARQMDAQGNLVPAPTVSE